MLPMRATLRFEALPMVVQTKYPAYATDIS